MTRLRPLVHRARRSRAAAAASIAVGALALALLAPSLLSALGHSSGPVGCHSGVDLSDDLTDDFTDDFTVEPVGEGSFPCPVANPDGGGDDSGGAGGGGPGSDVDAGVVSGSPTFTG